MSYGADSDSKVKKLKKTAGEMMQSLAFKELLDLKNNSDITKKHGTIEQILQKYAKSGFADYVTRSNLTYRMRLHNQGLQMRYEKPVEVVAVHTNVSPGDVSPLLEEDPLPSTIEANAAPKTTSTLTSQTNSTTTRVPGRRKGTTNIAKQEKHEAIQTGLIVATKTYLMIKKDYEKRGKRVPKLTLENIVKEIELDSSLVAGSISMEAVRCRIKKKDGMVVG